MRILIFYHSLVSDWNHGNAHFLRGVAYELLQRGHDVRVHEPRDSWSLQNLLKEHGKSPVHGFHACYPGLKPRRYRLEQLEIESLLDGADLVLVHEWNDPSLVNAIGACREKQNFTLLFHDTHHRMLTAPETMNAYALEHYDGVLAYGKVLRDMYVHTGRIKAAWTWHEAADTRVFHPLPAQTKAGDLVWIGNWGDDERAAELNEFLLEPVQALHLNARVYGVRYPEQAKVALKSKSIEYSGWLPNYDVPNVFSRYRVTVHVPRRPYIAALPGIPTIRPFEALACGIPLVSAPWPDVEGLFRPGLDYLPARDGREMTDNIRAVLKDERLAQSLAAHGLETIRSRHTCAHRVDELLDIVKQLAPQNPELRPMKRLPRQHQLSTV